MSTIPILENLKRLVLHTEKYRYYICISMISINLISISALEIELKDRSKIKPDVLRWNISDKNKIQLAEKLYDVSSINGLICDRTVPGLLNENNITLLIMADGGYYKIERPVISDGKLLYTIGDTKLALNLGYAHYLINSNAESAPGQLLDRLRVQKQDVNFDRFLIGQTWTEAVFVEGILNNVSDGIIKLEFEGEEREMPWTRILAVLFAQLKKNDETSSCFITLEDGSRIAVDSVEYAAQKWSISAHGVEKTVLPAKSVINLTFAPAVKVGSHDLLPERIVVRDYWDNDQSGIYDGTALSLNKRKTMTFKASTKLDYRLNRSYRRLKLEARIASDFRIGGVLLKLNGDGRPLMEPLRIQASDEGQKLEVIVDGIEVLSVESAFVDGNFGIGSAVTFTDIILE